MVYLTQGGFWLTFGQVFTTAVGFISSVAFAFYLPKNAYGDYKYVLSVFSIFSAFTLTGLSTAIVQSVARGFEGSLRQGVALSIRWSFFATIGALFGAAYYFFRDNIFLGVSMLFVALTIPFIHSYGLFASYINGKKDFQRMSLYSMIDNVVPTLAVLLTLFITQNVLILLAVYFLANTGMALILYKRTLSHFKPTEKTDGDLTEYSKKLSLLNVIGIITTHLDKVIVYTTLGASELAIYGFASAFPDQIRSLLKNLNSLMVPKFTEHKLTGRTVLLRQKTKQLAIVVVVITLAYLVLAPVFYNIFFPKYPESVYYSRILALTIISGLAMIPSSLFIAHKREKELARATIIGSTFQIAILIPAVYFGGLVGVCIARVLASTTNLGIAYYMIRKEFESEKNTH